jgi:hypothetical protein
MQVQSEKQVVREEVEIFTGFRRHFMLFIIVIAVIWILWLLLGNMSSFPWLLYPTAAWALVLIVHCIIAYSAINKRNKMKE